MNTFVLKCLIVLLYLHNSDALQEMLQQDYSESSSSITVGFQAQMLAQRFKNYEQTSEAIMDSDQPWKNISFQGCSIRSDGSTSYELADSGYRLIPSSMLIASQY